MKKDKAVFSVKDIVLYMIAATLAGFALGLNVGGYLIFQVIR